MQLDYYQGFERDRKSEEQALASPDWVSSTYISLIQSEE